MVDDVQYDLEQPASLEAAAANLRALRGELQRIVALSVQDRAILDSILDVSPYGIVVCDKQGKLTLQNRAANRIWAGQKPADDIAGWAQYRGFHRDGRPIAAEEWPMARCLLLGAIVEPEETHIERFDGTHAVLLVGCAPILTSSGEIAGAVSLFADITPWKRTEEALRLHAERYLTTLRSIGDAVVATDAEGRVTFMNPIAAALTGWGFSQAQGQPLDAVLRIIDQRTRQPVQSPLEQVRRTGESVESTNHALLISREGRECAISDRCAPIFSDSGVLAGLVLVFRDVTEKRREMDRRRFINEASALLASSLDFASTLASVAKLAVPAISDWCAVDVVEHGDKLRRLAVVHVDPAKVKFAEEIEARYPTDPAAPYSVAEVVRTGRPQLLSDISDAMCAAIAVDDEHLRLIRELGLKSYMVVPLRAHGITLGAITLVAAESQRKFGPSDLSFAEELANCAALAVNNARLYREAQQANRTKDEFLATISHELRTPLSAILGWVRLLRSGKMPEEKCAQGLETIERNARAQAQLIEDLLDVSRIISGKLRLELHAVDLITVIEAAASAVRLAADAKGVRLELLLDDTAAPARGDAGRLQQIVWNLLSNAVKFTDRGGSVTVRLSRADSRTQIEVSDTGRGIEPTFLPHVFEMFRQADATSTRAHGGLGLGLAIVRHLAELHGGTVHAESPGLLRGATFTVILPVAATVPQVVETDLRLEAPQPEPELTGLRVLLVDDEADARELLTEILVRRGALVTAVGCAADALSEIHKSPPEILVSDIGMPGCDGYTLIRRVREQRQSAKPLPAVALTAYARSEDRTRALRAGFHSHVTKPVEPEELVQVIATLAGRCD